MTISKTQREPQLPKTPEPSPKPDTRSQPAVQETARTSTMDALRADAAAKKSTWVRGRDAFNPNKSPELPYPSSYTKSDWSKGGVAQTQSIPRSAETGPRGAAVKRSVTLTYDAGPHSQLTDVRIKGSWDANGNPSSQWTEGIPMKPLGNGKWAVQVDLQDDGSGKELQWGVTADSPTGNDQWAVFGEENLKFKLGPTTKEVSYSPTTYHQMGAHKQGSDGVSFQFWAPDAKNVQVKITGQDGKVERMPMQRNDDGTWSAKASSGWKRLEGKSYVYEVTGSEGQKLERTDPYARLMQGEQTGIGRFYVDPKSGKEGNFYTPGRQEFMRFEIDDQPKATEAYLVLKDDKGHVLTKQELMDRLGTVDPNMVLSARNGAYNDLWSQSVGDDGRIKLTNVGGPGGAFSTVVNNPDALAGLHYELRAYEPGADGKLKLVDDKNKNGRFSAAERAASNYNDKWSDLITKDSGRTFRGGIITEPKYVMKYDGVPREKDHNKWTIYQLHVGSFMATGQNGNRSTFEDVMAKLDYLKELGINTIEMLPANENEGNRDWGYMGANSLAVESSYGFEDEKGNWVTGDEALRRMIDEAHRRGMNVLNDVVYNHVGGNYNSMWEVDGKENPYFNWSKDPSKFEQRDTPWGAVPAYQNPKVKQFFVDHAVAQVEDYHFDGLRFDFTEPIKGTGGKEGWDMLREINRQLHFYKPDVFTMAEQFDYDPAMTRPAEGNGKGGAGFDAQWYTEFQHRLVNDPGNPAIIQQAANGQRTNMDAFMGLLTNPRGLESWSKAVSMISNHDEVGNAQRTIDVADGSSTSKIPPQWARGAAKFAAGMGFTGPGTPMFFQGDESMAQNGFKWGVTSTWDNGWDWQDTGKTWDWPNVKFTDQTRASYDRLFKLSPDQRANDGEYKALSAANRQVFEDLAKLTPPEREQAELNIHRRQSFEFYKAAIALRKSSPAFAANAEVQRLYTHNENSVMAFTRKAGNEEFVVVGSLNQNNQGGYRMDLPPGNWKEVFNSDASTFGGNDFGNGGGTFAGNAALNLPAGGYIVLKKVG